MSAASVATTARPIPASSARRITCTIIGARRCRPAACREPGRRHAGRNQDKDAVVPSGRGYRRPRKEGLGIEGEWRPLGALIRVARKGQTFIARCGPASQVGLQNAFSACLPPLVGPGSLSHDGLVRTQQNSRRGARHVSCPAGDQHHRRRDLRPAEARKARLRHRRYGCARPEPRRDRRNLQSRSRSCSRLLRREGPTPPRSATPATPSRRAGQQGRPEPVRRRQRARRARIRAASTTRLR